MANQRLLSGSVPSDPWRPPAGVALHRIGEEDLADVGRGYWSAYRGTADEMSLTAASDDVLAAWNGEYGRWLTAGSLLARIGDDLCGAIITVEDPPWPDVPRGPFITDLFVVPDARRRGIGRALVHAVQRAIPTPIGLRVDDSAPDALRLYLSLGFAPAG